MRVVDLHSLIRLTLAGAISFAGQALAAADADTDAAALSLESAAPANSADTRDTRIFIEGALGNASQRYLPHSQDLGRASLDFSHSMRLAPGWRAVVSNRLDHIHPRDTRPDAMVNSLREAFLSWQPGGESTLVEFGRINLRYGPGYGYNPTDYFRDGSLRAYTTADPFSLRENRLGTVMLRAQHLWSGGSFSIALSPKLADRPNADGWSLDLGSTNNRDRSLVALGTQHSERVSSQLLVYKQAGSPLAVGANVTALLSDAATAHFEWSRSREADLQSRALALPGVVSTRNRFVGGATYTTASKLSVTAEYQYNGFGLSRSGWAGLAGNPAGQFAYLREALQLQELAPRQAVLIYVMQKGFGLKDMDLAAYVRYNPGDNSRLLWFELRHHWPSFDLTFQLQQNMGRSTSEFGVLPDRRTMQVLGTYYF